MKLKIRIPETVYVELAASFWIIVGCTSVAVCAYLAVNAWVAQWQ